MQMRYRERELNDRRSYPQFYSHGGHRNSGVSESGYPPYSNLKSDRKTEKAKQKKKRDIIVPDEEEEFPFAKYTFNKKPDKGKPMSSVKFADKTYSKESIASKSLMDQYTFLHGPPDKKLTASSSSSSLFSSVTSNSFTDTYSSPEDLSLNDSYDFDWQRNHSGPLPNASFSGAKFNQMFIQNGAKMVPGFGPYPGIEFCPPASPVPVDFPTSNAEQILSSLGFSESQNFLPERFLRSWVNKMVQNQQRERELFRQQMGLLQQPYYNISESSYDDVDLPPSVSAQHSGRSTPKWRQSLEHIHAVHPPTSRPKINRRKYFHRSHSLNPTLKQGNNFSTESYMTSTEIENEKEFGSIGALPIAKENSFDRLKRILQNTVSHMPNEVRRNQFSSNRQNSLPLFLETLSEEEEAKSRSRSPSFEKIWDSKEKRLSRMQNFFQEEERKSCSASEGSPENSRKGSLNDTRMAEVINGIKEKIEKTGDLDSISSNDTTHNNTENMHQDVSSNKHQILQLPSIVVSERDDSEAGSLKNCEIDPHTRPVSPRPVSPNPDSQQRRMEDVSSKDSLEIAEIMANSERKGSLKSYAPNLDSISSPDNTTHTGLRKRSLHESDHSSSRFLKINTDFDDKCLSPSSTASPLELSPITVIELGRLDNQNDSLETEDSLPKAPESESSICKGSIKSLGVKSKGNSSAYSKKHHTSATKRNSLGLDQIPKKLSLERRSYERETRTDGDKDSLDEEFEKVCVEFEEKGVQTADDVLPPILKFSDFSSVLQNLLKKLPDYGENLFYLAQDRGTQYEGYSVTANYSEETFDSREESDKIDSGITSNKGSNESGSVLSPMQASPRLSSRNSNVEIETSFVSEPIGYFSTPQDKNKENVNERINKRTKQPDVCTCNDTFKTQHKTETKIYRSEAFISIGKPELNRKTNTKIFASEGRIHTPSSSELSNAYTSAEKQEAHTDSIMNPRNSLSAESNKNVSLSHKSFNDDHLSLKNTSADVRTSDMIFNNNIKKNVTFSMTDSQEEKEDKRKQNLQRLERTRLAFRGKKFFSFDSKKLYNKLENSDRFNDQIMSQSYETFMRIPKDEISNESSSKENMSSQREENPVLKFSFNNVRLNDNSGTERSMAYMKSDKDLTDHFRPLDNNFTSIENKFNKENTPLKMNSAISVLDKDKELYPNYEFSDCRVKSIHNSYEKDNNLRNNELGVGKYKKSFSISNDSCESSDSRCADSFNAFGHFNSKSLDFDSVGSRRAIFQRGFDAVFSKSFDTGSSDLSGGSFSSLEPVPEDFVAMPLSKAWGKDLSQESKEETSTVISVSETEDSDNTKLGFLDIDLNDIDRYCDMTDIQVLDNIDEECEELEKFIDSYVDLGHDIVQDENIEDKVSHNAANIAKEPERGKLEQESDIQKELNDIESVTDVEDDCVHVEEDANKEPVTVETFREDMNKMAENENFDINRKEKDVSDYTYKDVKIKTFHLGKNSINMRTFGNYSCNDTVKNKVTVTPKVSVTITDVDSVDSETTYMPVIIESDEEIADEVFKSDSQAITEPIAETRKGVSENLPQYREVPVVDSDSEKMKKIKELYKSFSFGDFEVFGFDESLNDDNEAVKIISEKYDKNLTFEELFAQNVEYLGNDDHFGENSMNERHGDDSTSKEQTCRESIKQGPYVNFVTHNCLNCGHTVTVAMHVEQSYQEDHDFCVQCSPLDISVENLERKRQEKHNNE